MWKTLTDAAAATVSSIEAALVDPAAAAAAAGSTISSTLDAAVNATAPTEEPLLCAAIEGDLTAVRLLVAGGAAVDLPRDGQGHTALHLALYWGSVTAGCDAVADFLITAHSGAAPDSRTLAGWTPLHMAARFGRAPQAVALLAAAQARGGSGSGSGGGGGGGGGGQRGGNKALLDAANKNGRTALMLALKHGHEPLALELISAGADVSRPSADGWFPLHYAAAAAGGSVSAVAAILQRLADKGNGATAAVNAVGGGHSSSERGSKLVGLDVAVAADVRAPPPKTQWVNGIPLPPAAAAPVPRTPLQLALEGGHEDVAVLLLKVRIT